MPAPLAVHCSFAELNAHTLRILERLVAFDTTSGGSNLGLIRYTQQLLSGNGIQSTLRWSPDRTRANLVATVGAGAGRGIVWAGHTDVVPVLGQNWTTDPFALRVDGTRATGRGSADMKGFLACALAVLSQLEIRDLQVPVTLLLTYDEEVGCLGAHSLVDELRGWEGTVGCVLGEPSGMRPVIGHKGKQNYSVTFAGEPRHAALAPATANPIASAADFVSFAESMNEKFRADGPHDGRFTAAHSWINVGRVDGGTKPNVVPADCTIDLEIRSVPGHPCDVIAGELSRYATETVLRRMRARYPAAAVSFVQRTDTPAFDIDAGHPFVRRMAGVLGPPADPEHVSFGTEAGVIWGRAGIPAVVCGPGQITEAHAADEFVELDQLRLCLAGLLQCQ